jgi:2-haloacid dehalogenase
MITSLTNGLAIIFDFGGVLFDWDPHYLYLKYFNDDWQAVDRFLKEIQFEAWNLRQDQGRPFSTAVTEHCAKFPRYCDLIRAYDSHWEESIRGPISGSVEILESLWKAGHPLFALSNWSEEKFELIRARYRFIEYFQAVVISGSAGVTKPDPGIFRILLDKIGRNVGDCLIIDDAPANIATAQRLGFRTIHFQSPEQLKMELSALGIREIRTSH